MLNTFFKAVEDVFALIGVIFVYEHFKIFVKVNKNMKKLEQEKQFKIKDK